MPTTNTPTEPTEKYGIKWHNDAAQQVASMIKEADETALKNDQSVLSEVLLGIKVTSLIFGLTSNALSNAQDIVSKKSALGADSLGDLFSQAKSILSASANVISDIGSIKAPDSDQITAAITAAKEAWNIVNFLRDKANSSCASSVINGTLKTDFNNTTPATDLKTAQKNMLLSSLFYTNIYHAYIHQSFISGGPDFAKQAYNLSIAQTTFGLLKDLVDASGEVMSDLQVNGPQAILKELLMNNSNNGKPSYDELKTAVGIPNTP